ncbi:hypothetical protein DVH24_042073 [Malus domestica]|uniref:Uncharacterized protein n=1 Tax=Malus domestica TaxID=3750 RepID=A0A498IT12_MALDO|nr:hypothetical protein DVH24_042073 [Malus domestica]
MSSATSVEKANSPPKSKKTRQTKERVEEEVATSVKIYFAAEKEEPEANQECEKEVATSVEKADSLPRKLVTQEVSAADEDGEESRFIGKPMEDEEARKQYPKRYVGEFVCCENVGDLGVIDDQNYALLVISCERSMLFRITGSRKERKKCYERTITKSIAPW